MVSVAKTSPGVKCEIHATRNESGTRIEALISGTGPIAGNYTLTVTPHDGGSAVKSENGDFKIETSSPTVLNKASLDLPSDKGYSASLHVTWPNGSSSCSSSVS